MSNLHPYPEYKDSDLTWLGQIPSHWECLPHRALFKEIKEQGHVNEKLLSVTISRGVVRQEDLLKDASKKDSSNQDKSKYKLVEPGDITYNKMRAWQGAAGVSRYPGIVSPAYIVVRLRTDQNPEYFHYLFRTPGFAKEAERWSYGITSDQWSLRPQHFKMIYSCLPPRPEQDAIVRFLREQDKKVRRFIRNRRRLIEVLNEQRQAIINRAVTRGLEPSTPLKPSGIDWLGDIPEHWEVVALRYLATKFGSGVTPRGGAAVYQETGVPFLRSQNIHFGGLRLDGVVRIPPELHASLPATHVRPKDVLLNITGASIGRVCAVPSDFTEGNVNQHVCIIRPRSQRIVSGFLAAYLSTGFMQHEIYITQKGASREGLTLNAIRAFKIILPPLDEQERILNSIKSATCGLVAACSKAEREIDLIREYRTRLISDVVTGKVDVRHLAPPPGSEDLEEMVEDLEPLDDAAGELDEGALAEEVPHADD